MNPWWQVTLEKTLYVESVKITNNVDCCPREIGIIKVTVSTNAVGLDPTCTESMEYGGKTEDYKFLCSPPARGSYVRVTLIGDNVTLVLCQVMVNTIGKSHCKLTGYAAAIFPLTQCIHYEQPLIIRRLANLLLTAEKFSRMSQDEMCVTSLATRLLFFGQRKMQRRMKQSTVSRFDFLFSPYNSYRLFNF